VCECGESGVQGEWETPSALLTTAEAEGVCNTKEVMHIQGGTNKIGESMILRFTRAHGSLHRGDLLK
jgi:hypothetical protein